MIDKNIETYVKFVSEVKDLLVTYGWSDRGSEEMVQIMMRQSTGDFK